MHRCTREPRAVPRLHRSQPSKSAFHCIRYYLFSTNSTPSQVIAEYLLTLLTTPPSPSSPEIIIQSASSLIDIYSDENTPYDINFRSHGYLAGLSSRGVENLRRAVRAVDRKKEGGRMLRARGEETLENLRAFVKYRRELKL